MDAQIISNNIVLEDEIEYNKDEIKEAFKDLDVITNKKKKVKFQDDKRLVTIIKVESYKKYNSPILIREILINKNQKDKKIIKNKESEKNKHNSNKKRKCRNQEEIYDKDEDVANSCFIF